MTSKSRFVELKYRVEERLETYKSTFDVVICNDSNLQFVFDLVKYIVEEYNFPSVKEEVEEERNCEECIVIPPSLG